MTKIGMLAISMVNQRDPTPPPKKKKYHASPIREPGSKEIKVYK